MWCNRCCRCCGNQNGNMVTEFQRGFNAGFGRGWNDGFNSGYSGGFNDGYQRGLEACANASSGESGCCGCNTNRSCCG